MSVRVDTRGFLSVSVEARRFVSVEARGGSVS